MQGTSSEGRATTQQVFGPSCCNRWGAPPTYFQSSGSHEHAFMQCIIQTCRRARGRLCQPRLADTPWHIPANEGVCQSMPLTYLISVVVMIMSSSTRSAHSLTLGPWLSATHTAAPCLFHLLPLCPLSLMQLQPRPVPLTRILVPSAVTCQPFPMCVASCT